MQPQQLWQQQQPCGKGGVSGIFPAFRSPRHEEILLRKKQPQTALFAAAAAEENNENEKVASEIPSSDSDTTMIMPAIVRNETLVEYLQSVTDLSIFYSPVLEQVWPSLCEYARMYGHINIPLGTTAGKQCLTLRRLHQQGKLSEQAVDILTRAGFVWHSLEDVYRTCNFNELLERLKAYSALTEDGNVSPPKKYAPDPELGAWVTGIRRVGAANIPAEQREALDAIGFAWTSPRQCGSAFMEKYRQIRSELESASSATEGKGLGDCGHSRAKVLAHYADWIRAQRQAAQRGALSETRQHYLKTLLGENWLQDDLQSFSTSTTRPQ